MTLEQRLNALATAIGADIKALRLADGNLATLSTTAKSNLVAAINEVYALAQSAGVIDDAAATTVTDKTYSAQKITTNITAAIAGLRDELRAGAGAALDTFAEVAAQLAADESTAAALATAVGNRVRFDAAQALTTEQQDQARANIAAASQSQVDFLANYQATLGTNIANTQGEVDALETAVGNTDRDLVADYAAAKA